MSLAERQQRFLEAVQGHFGTAGRVRPNKLFGVSNSAKVVEGGLQLGVVNLDGARDDSDAFIFACVMKFPPEDEVYFAVLVRNDKANFLARLAEMKRHGAGVQPNGNAHLDEDDSENRDGDLGFRYAARNNNVPIYIAQDGRLWLRNSGFWDSLNIDLAPFGPPTDPDEIVVALYPPTASARRSLLAREFIGWLGCLVGRPKIHELRVWADAAAVSSEMRRPPASVPVAHIEAAVSTSGRLWLRAGSASSGSARPRRRRKSSATCSWRWRARRAR